MEGRGETVSDVPPTFILQTGLGNICGTPRDSSLGKSSSPGVPLCQEQTVRTEE